MKTLVGFFDWVAERLWSRQSWYLETYLAAQAIVWGLWLLSPWESFDVAPDVYSLLGRIPESLWGAIFLAHGLVHLFVLWTKRPVWCRRAALAASGLWAVVVVSLLVTAPVAPTIPIYALSMIAAALVYVRLYWRFH